MISALFRALCKLRHRGEFLRPARVGGLRCLACGAGYVDLLDAGLLLLNSEEARVSNQVLALLEGKLRDEPSAHLFAAGSWRVIKGKRVVKRGRYDAGEPVEVAS